MIDWPFVKSWKAISILTFIVIAFVGLALAKKFEILRINGKIYACSKTTKKMSSGFPYWEARCDQISAGRREIILTFFIRSKDVYHIATKCGLKANSSIVIMSRLFMKDIISYVLLNDCNNKFVRDIRKKYSNRVLKTTYYFQGLDGRYMYDTLLTSINTRSVPLRPFMSTINDSTTMYFCADQFDQEYVASEKLTEFLPLKKMILKCRT